MANIPRPFAPVTKYAVTDNFNYEMGRCDTNYMFLSYKYQHNI